MAAEAGVLVDASDGQMLWEKNAHQRRAIASTTKIVTALVVLERADPEAIVTTSARAEAIGAGDPLVTELELRAGERLRVRDLLYGMLLPSASDAALALAEHVGGSISGFVELMNARARELGAADSHFTNPHGLDDPGHYSSAFDVALFTRAALGNPLFREIVATRSHTIARESGATTIVNRNVLLGAYPGADGVKTGQTQSAGRTLVASATRQGERRIAVALSSPNPAGDAAGLLEYGFSFRRVTLAARGGRWGTATFGDGTTWRLIATQDLRLLLPPSDPDPAATYDAARRQLVVRLSNGGELRAGLQYACGGPCRHRARRRSAAELAWSMLAPLARLAAGSR